MSVSSEQFLRDFPIPLIGFAAFSGTGKTTLLLKLLPLLKQRGLRVGVVKHAHHTFEMDYPGKDSYRLREAGADEMLVAARCRFALIRECPEPAAEPKLSEALALVRSPARKAARTSANSGSSRSSSAASAPVITDRGASGRPGRAGPRR